MNCPYDLISTDPNFCKKCRRCTPEGFSNFIDGSGNKYRHAHVKGGNSTKGRSRTTKKSSPYTFHYEAETKPKTGGYPVNGSGTDCKSVANVLSRFDSCPPHHHFADAGKPIVPTDIEILEPKKDKKINIPLLLRSQVPYLCDLIAVGQFKKVMQRIDLMRRYYRQVGG